LEALLAIEKALPDCRIDLGQGAWGYYPGSIEYAVRLEVLKTAKLVEEEYSSVLVFENEKLTKDLAAKCGPFLQDSLKLSHCRIDEATFETLLDTMLPDEVEVDRTKLSKKSLLYLAAHPNVAEVRCVGIAVPEELVDVAKKRGSELSISFSKCEMSKAMVEAIEKVGFDVDIYIED
ncbi:MAG: hypothetical protein AAF517_27550, partial [Planctomycetota bacterium]